MTQRLLQRPSQPTLTYELAGHAGETVVLCSPPGVSVKFWLPLIRELRDRYRTIHVDYRGFPRSERVFEAEEVSLERLVEDLHAVVTHEQADGVHLVGWCNGAKLAAAYSSAHRSEVRSLALMNIEHDGRDTFAKSQFGRLVAQVERRLARKPERIHSFALALRSYVADPNAHYVAMAREDYDPSPLLRELDVQEDLRSLAFHLLAGAENLANFLKINAVIRTATISRQVRELDVPVLILQGEADETTTLSDAEADSLLGENPLGARHEIPAGGHFMLLERPRVVAEALVQHMQRARVGAPRGADVAAAES